MKKFYGRGTYVQSVGVRSDMEIDGFAIAVCAEIGVGLSPASLRRAQELTRYFHLEVEYWQILDPTGLGETREDKLNAYRQARDQIVARLIDKWGAPVSEEPDRAGG